jgi:arylsulfatase A-like enzyme
VWAAPAGVALAVCLAGIGHQVLWQDELATFTASTRSLDELVQLAKERDGVLAAYYALIHLWTEVFGASPVALRVPSALAMAAAAGVTALLGARLFNPRAGLLAGLLLAVVPAVSEFGQEARPYALTVLLAAVSTLLLLRALERPRASQWGLYALSLAALGAAQLTAMVLIGAHAFAVAAEWRSSRDRHLTGWLVACGVAAVALVPLIYVGSRQTEQVAGVPETTWQAIGALPGQLFAAPVVAGAVIGLGLLGAFRQRRASLLCVALAIVPVVLLLLVSLELPVLRSRYLLFTLLGWVLLGGATLSRYGKPEATAALLGISALGLPAQLEARSGTLNDSQPDYRAIARILEDRTREGDAIVVPTERGIRFRIGLNVYVPDDARPEDVLATRSPAAAAALDSWECQPATCIGSPRRVWVGCDRACTDPLSGIKSETAKALEERGYVPEQVWQVEGGAISLYKRPSRSPGEGTVPPRARQAPVETGTAPNFVVILTDDQDPASLSVMRHAKRDLGASGVTFEHAFASAPQCCPSRVSLLTGQYVHNHGVISNEPPDGGHSAFKANDGNALPVWLEDAGYRTGYVGKYLNGYGWSALGNDPTEVPPGWTYWAALANHTEYQMYGYAINENGQLETYSDAPADYQTDVLARKADAFIKASTKTRKPFFLTVAPAAPHDDPVLEDEDVPRNPRPAPRDEGRFEDEPLPQGPAFSERDISDKPQFIKRDPEPSSEDISDLTVLYRSRLESLIAVDDMVHRLAQTCRKAGELANTTFIFTSDNGYLLGEHRQTGKLRMYEESAGVPLVIRGPGFSGGVVRDQLVSNIDLAATIVEQSGVTPGLRLDGVSLLPAAPDAPRQRPPVLIEMLSERTFAAIRTPRFVLAEHDKAGTELYDLRRDPHELDNLRKDPRYRATKRRLSKRLNRLRDCAGASCR